MDIQFFIELFFGGLTRGSIYALIALGYTLVYGIIGLINFAHGEIYMLGAFTALLVAGVLGVYGFPAAGILVVAALAAMVWCAAYGYTLEKVAYKPLRTAPRLSPLISAIGMSIFLQNYVLLAQTSDFVPFPNLLPEMDFLEHIGYVMGPSDFLILLVSTIAMVSLSLFIRYTRMGKAMRATSQNRKMALLLGINADRIISLTFIVGSSLAAWAAYSSPHTWGRSTSASVFWPGSRPLPRPCWGASAPFPAPCWGAWCWAWPRASLPDTFRATMRTSWPSAS